MYIFKKADKLYMNKYYIQTIYEKIATKNSDVAMSLQ